VEVLVEISVPGRTRLAKYIEAIVPDARISPMRVSFFKFLLSNMGHKSASLASEFSCI
jgi:hypothetical protein